MEFLTNRRIHINPLCWWAKKHIHTLKYILNVKTTVYIISQPTPRACTITMSWDHTHPSTWRLVQCRRLSARAWAPASSILFQLRLDMWIMSQLNFVIQNSNINLISQPWACTITIIVLTHSIRSLTIALEG